MSAKVSFLTFPMQDFDLVIAYTVNHGYASSVLVTFKFQSLPLVRCGTFQRK